MNLNDAEFLVKEKMGIWLDNSWNFQFDNKKRAMGTCSERTNTIFLSRTYTLGRSRVEVLNTILHEIAHALAGCRNGHNSVWKAACIRVGARPEATSKVDMTLEERGVKWVCVEVDGTVCKSWYRKPRKTTFDQVSSWFIPARKEETLGKLTIIPFKG